MSNIKAQKRPTNSTLRLKTNKDNITNKKQYKSANLGSSLFGQYLLLK